MKQIVRFIISLLKYWYYAGLCKKIDYFDYQNLLKWEYNPPLFFNSVCLYGNYKAVANLCHKRFNFLTDYLEHGLTFIPSAESARLLGYIDRKGIKNVYTFGSIRHSLINQYLQDNALQRNVIEVGPYILGAEHFYSPQQLQALKSQYGKILLVYPQHSIENNVVSYGLDEIVEEIRSRKADFDSVFVCLYWKDILMHPEYVQRYQQEGFIVVSNGHRSDPMFLSRQKDLIALSDMMITNGLGTHIGYSVAMNRPVYFFQQQVNIASSSKDIVERNNSLSAVESVFAEAFGTYQHTISSHQRELVEQYWGKSHPQ